MGELRGDRLPNTGNIVPWAAHNDDNQVRSIHVQAGDGAV